MNIANIQELIKKFKELPVLPEKEVNIFSLGTKNYYENPTTDILAFFLDNNESHNLGSLVLDSLIECLNKDNLDILNNLIENIERETVTYSGKRIDLILETNDTAFVIENKIYHNKNNPFEEYEEYAKNIFKKKDKIIYIILSIDGISEIPNWNGVSYKDFINNIKKNLGIYLINNPISKWTILLREFLLHIENITTKEIDMNEKEISFIFDNYLQLKDIEEFRKKILAEFVSKIQARLNDELKFWINARIHSWEETPAFRLFISNINTTNVTLFFSDIKNKKIAISVYAKQSDKIDEYFEEFKETDEDAIIEGNEKVYCKYLNDLEFDPNKSFDKIIELIKVRIEKCLKYESDVLNINC